MPFIADDNLWCQDATGKMVDLSWLDSGPNLVVEQGNDVLQELSQNDLHGLVPETEDEEMLRNMSDPGFELESIFAVINNSEANAKSNPEEETAETMPLCVQQFQQQLEEFGQQHDHQQKNDSLVNVSSTSFNMADSSCLFNSGTSNMAISNPLLHQRLTTTVSPPMNSSTNQGPGPSLLASVLASSSAISTSSSGPSASINASSTCSSSISSVMPSSSTENVLIKEETCLRK
ncbi:uncharacterized protein LOC129218717 [Uloborus diversus]|uniref:uncharacterized protein LOC129218717 n=1 Tax=Uloborus diversus TaxID=327109 RepID=UPI0024095474|nr:uncharacterized protein LOC129218717 [Uloborus diversus]